MKTYNAMLWALSAIEIVAAITGLLFFRKLKNSYWKWFPLYLVFIVCLESAGRYLASVPELNSYNPLMFKLLGFPVQFLFFYFLFYVHEYFKDKKKWVIAGTLIYLLSIITDLLFLSNKTYWFSSFSYSIGNLVLLVFILQFFLAFIRSNDILHFSKNLMFWVCLGLFVYYLGSLPYWGLRNVLVLKYGRVFIGYSYVMFVLNYIMYLLFITGIILCRLR